MDDNGIIAVGLTAMLFIGLVGGYWAGGANKERERWCRMTYTELAKYETCLVNPDWEKKEE